MVIETELAFTSPATKKAAFKRLLAAQFELALDATTRSRALTPPLAPVKAQLPVLNSHLTITAALRVIVLETVRHLQSNEPGINCDDTEFFHQMRVALRRLRSALTAFSEITNDNFWRTIDTDTRWLAGLLGDVRDIDVLLRETLPAIEPTLTTQLQMNTLKLALQQRRQSCYKTLIAALNSARYARLLLRLLLWLNSDTAAHTEKNRSLEKFAQCALSKRRHQVIRMARRWKELDAEQRHTLRKRAKKLRYAAEFFSSLYQPKSVQHYLKKLQTLQQLFGSANDALTAQTLLKKLTSHDATLAKATGVIDEQLACAEKNTEPEIKQAITTFKKTKPFW